ncbi:class I SAM-dependent methyltransferase [Brevundimonas kwangchunensis]|uniref:Class I SAM-dependent methyltransferase n=1 Tax=Brevundimonas kwangchunensis TaxID=322163 RepID=A0ABN1H157_9CAUL
MDWSEGYYAGLDYTFGYYHEMGPDHLRLACLTAGVHCEIPDASTYLELGFGQGVSINLHAAGSEGAFHGVDFNPAHVLHAEGLAERSGATVHLSDESFAAFAARKDLPMFDVIALHGVWSWVSDENRRVILDLIRKKLRRGGVVYLSYNCMPGWASRGAVRHLLNLGRARGSEAATTPEAEVDRALAFVGKVTAAGPRFFRDEPQATKHAAGLAKQSRRYIAHEYFNADWHVPYFSDVATEMAGAKLTFVDSARLLDRIAEINIPADGVALLAEISEPVMRESVRDYLVNQRFRPDIFVKGAIRLSKLEQDARLGAQAFVLICPLDEIDFRISGALGEATLPEAIYRPLSEALAAEAFRPKTAAVLAETASASFDDVIAALTVLTGMGVVRPAREATPTTRGQCDGYNALVLERALSGRQLKHMASPVTGGGVLTTRSTQLFLQAWNEGARTPEALAARVWAVFERTNERATKDGRDVVSREENLQVLGEKAERFLMQILPLYRTLGILPSPKAG